MNTEKIAIEYRYSRHDQWSVTTVTLAQLSAELVHLFQNGAEIRAAK